MVSLTDINARLPSVQTGIAYIQTDIYKIYTFLDTLCTTYHVSSITSPFNPPGEILENIKEVW